MTSTLTSVAVWRRVLLVSIAALIAALAITYAPGDAVYADRSLPAAAQAR